MEGGLERNYSGNLRPEKQFINHCARANAIQISLLAAVTGPKVHTPCLCGFHEVGSRSRRGAGEVGRASTIDIGRDKLWEYYRDGEMRC